MSKRDPLDFNLYVFDDTVFHVRVGMNAIAAVYPILKLDKKSKKQKNIDRLNALRGKAGRWG